MLDGGGPGASLSCFATHLFFLSPLSLCSSKIMPRSVIYVVSVHAWPAERAISELNVLSHPLPLSHCLERSELLSLGASGANHQRPAQCGVVLCSNKPWEEQSAVM